MRSLFLVLVFLSGLVQAAEIRGRVVNSRGGESLEKVAVSLLETSHSTHTSSDGSFILAGIPPGKYTLVVDAIGFWRERLQFEVESDTANKDFDIALEPEGGRRIEKVEVIGDLFHGPDVAEVSLLDVTATELKQTGTLLASDPYRTVQSLPGVSAAANNDLFAQFTVLGAPFSSLALYMDDIPVNEPLHGIPGDTEGASVGILNNDVIESISLTPLAFSERYANGTGGALDIRTREGSRSRTSLNLLVGLGETHGTAEGGLDKRKGSWLFSARKSYIGYLTHQAANEPSVDVSFYDLHGKVAYDFSPKFGIDVEATHGKANLNQADADALSTFQLNTGQNKFDFARVGWRMTLNPKLLWSLFGAFVDSSYQEQTRDNYRLSGGSWGEWVGGTKLLASINANNVSEVGWLTVRQRNSTEYSDRDPEHPESVYSRPGTALQHGAYAQQSSSFFGGRLHAMGGLRWDHIDTVAANPLSPQASADLRVGPSTHLQFGYGRYLLFPWPDSTLVCGAHMLMFVRSTHYVAGVEQRLGEFARLRAQVFERNEQEQYGVRGGYQAYQSLLAGNFSQDCGPIERSAVLASKPPGSRARGAQIVIQRRSANRLSGWISYTYLHATQPGFFGNDAPTIFDQRHTVNVFTSYRLRPSIILGGKLLYGSGYPISGSFIEISSNVYQQQAGAINQIRLDPYFRLDPGISKAFSVRGRRFTIYGEVLNVTNHRNMRVTSTNYLQTGQVILNIQRTLGITPTVGVGFQF